MPGYKDFTAGSVLTAADLEDYLELQSVMSFADSSARDTALTSVLREGIHAWERDANRLCVYDGTG